MKGSGIKHLPQITRLETVQPGLPQLHQSAPPQGAGNRDPQTNSQGSTFLTLTLFIYVLFFIEVTGL